jgi:hypothetical protein
MDWLLLVMDRKDEAPRESVGVAEMGQFAGELGRSGKIRGGARLHPHAESACVAVRGGRASVTDGPFAEAKEVVGGFFAVDAATRAEAIEIARRCPYTRAGFVEVHAAPDRDVVEAEPGTRYMLILHMAHDLTDPDGAKYREMVAFDGELKGESAYVESASLPLDPPAARVEQRGGKTTVTDGPFAESKEIAGGYYVVTAKDRTAALELARRCPHARWGTIEVRELAKPGAS